MKKVSELTGVELDYWVAKAEGQYEAYVTRRELMGDPVSLNSLNEWMDYAMYSPSTDWAQGGEIIDSINICLGWSRAKKHTAGHGPNKKIACGETKLIAAMRCYLIIMIGETVDDSQTNHD